jgi:prepilin-type N-terminal cleavage/methylation domain-containing protein
MRSARSGSSEAGFSLIEVLAATTILGVVAIGVAQLFGVAIMANMNAKSRTSTTVLAAQKMEQLRGLTWGFDTQQTGLGLPLSDTTTDLSVDPPTSTGRGLNPSPPGTLRTNTPGYVDFLDADGRWVGTGSAPPPNAVYVRRWSIEPLPTNPNNTLILQVVVSRLQRENLAALGPGQRPRLADDAWLVTVKTRKAP